MCAITGLVDCVSAVSSALVTKMRDVMTHRGPDAGGTWISPDGVAGLGHRRLAIIDLSERSQQPMIDPVSGTAIVFNGEIYNYRELKEELNARGILFRTESDTEVILGAYRLWGRDCLQRLKGMFAMGIWDTEKRTLLLARDRAGEKPLFYRQIGPRFIFGSELKALFEHPECDRVLDIENFLFYLSMGYVPGERCLLRGFSKVSAGSWVEVKTQRESLTVTKGKYWSLPDGEGAFRGGELEEFEQRLNEAVKRQLVADVPVGILLSGGVDSSLVAAAARRNTTGRIRTFTVRFPGHRHHDESEHARLVAQHLETEHHELDAESASVELLPRLAHHFDEPIVDSSMIPTYLVSRLVREHCTVALGGDGGDELFAGYVTYRRLLKFAAAVERWPLPLRRALAFGLDQLYPQSGRGRNWISALKSDFRRQLPFVTPHYDAGRRSLVLSREVLAALPNRTIPEDYFEDAAEGNTLLQRATRSDFKLYLCDDILTKVDRSSMANSLEMRSPLLYPDLIEFAFGLPDVLRATSYELKILPKQLCRKVFPASFNLTRKQGFSIPLAEWLKGDFGCFFESVLGEADSALFDREFLLHLLRKNPECNTERLFGPVFFELWRREFKISLP